MNYYIPRPEKSLDEAIVLKNAVWKFQQDICPHCQYSKTLKSHGPLIGRDKHLRGFRLFCSNRNSNRGCGKTISVFFDDIIQGTQLGAEKVTVLLKRLCGQFKSANPWAVEKAAEGICSRATSYRWKKKMEFHQSHFRSLATRLAEPPHADMAPIMKTWTLLESAFSGAISILSGFQLILQRPAFSRLPKGLLSNFHRSFQHGSVQKAVTTKGETVRSHTPSRNTQNLSVPLRI